MIYAAGIALACLLSLILFTQKNKTVAVHVLAAWLAVIGLHLFLFYLFTKQYANQYPSLVTLSFSLPLLHGPFLYWYTTLQTGDPRFRLKHLLHFIPFIAGLFLFLPFHLLPFSQRVHVFTSEGIGFETEMLINTTAIYLSGPTYCLLALKKLLQYRKQIPNEFSNTERISYTWLLYLIIWMMVIWTVVLTVPSNEVLYTMVVVFVFWMGYFGIKQAQVFVYALPVAIKSWSAENTLAETGSERLTETTRYQKSSLTQEQAAIIYRQLVTLMDEKQPYKNPELTLTNLAGMLEVHPNVLSQVINVHGNQTFYELVNEKRVKAFLELIAQSQNVQYTLLALAMECGFNSKASFNRNFKKHTGLTPSEYVKKNQPIAHH